MRTLSREELGVVAGGTGWLDYRVGDYGRNVETGELMIHLYDPLGNANTGYLGNDSSISYDGSGEFDPGITIILDGLSGNAFSSGQEAADAINDAMDRNGDCYQFRDIILAVFGSTLPQDIQDAYTACTANN
jgi:hypothetical protein